MQLNEIFLTDTDFYFSVAGIVGGDHISSEIHSGQVPDS